MTGVTRPFSVPSVLFRPELATTSVRVLIIPSSTSDVIDHVIDREAHDEEVRQPAILDNTRRQSRGL